MIDLIARLEAAAAGSRELSDEVLTAAGWAFDEEADSWIPPDGGWWGSDEPGPHVTDSLDAALSLLPEGWAGQIGFGQPGEEGCWMDAPDGNSRIYSMGATPALSMSIAVLKALSGPSAP